VCKIRELMLFNDSNFDCYVISKPTPLFGELTEEE
jgi:hypothetical protein